MKGSVNIDHLGLQARVLAPPKPMEQSHLHTEVELNQVMRGSVTYLSRGRLQRLEAGELTMFLGTTPHSLVMVEPGTEMVWLTLPLAWVMSWNLPPPALKKLLGGEWLSAPPRSGDRFPLAAWARELDSIRGRPKPGRRLLLELEACALWLAESSTKDRRQTKAADTGMHHVEAMAKVMAKRYQEPLSVPEVAKAVGLHPNYAMNVFRQRTGMTIRGYLAELRVTHAQQLLLTTDRKIVDISLDCGFSTLSAFYASFVRSMGIPPNVYRNMMRS